MNQHSPSKKQYGSICASLCVTAFMLGVLLVTVPFRAGHAEDKGKCPALTNPDMGSSWKVKEGQWEGTWTRQGQTNKFFMDMTYGPHKIHDELTVQKFDSSGVKIYRDGTKGYYRAEISCDGKSIVNGRGDWFVSGDRWSADILNQGGLDPRTVGLTPVIPEEVLKAAKTPKKTRQSETQEDKDRAMGTGEVPAIFANKTAPNDFGLEENITIVDTRTNQVLDTFNGGKNPHFVAMSENGLIAYVNNYKGNVSIINPKTNLIYASIDLGGNPNRIALSRDGLTAFVLTFDSVIHIINAKSRSVTHRIKVGEAAGDIKISPDSSTIYASNPDTGNFLFIDVPAQKVTGKIELGGHPGNMAISPNGSFLYVANSGYISLIDLRLKKAKKIPLDGTAQDLAISRNGALVYVCNPTQNTIVVMSTKSNETVKTIKFDGNPRSISMGPRDENVYVADASAGQVKVVSAKTGAIINTLKVGGDPTSIATSASGNLAYVTNYRPRTEGQFGSDGVYYYEFWMVMW